MNLKEFIAQSAAHDRAGRGSFMLKAMLKTILETDDRYAFADDKRQPHEIIADLLDDAIGCQTSVMAHILIRYLANTGAERETITAEDWNNLATCLESLNLNDWSYDEAQWPWFSYSTCTSPRELMEAYFETDLSECDDAHAILIAAPLQAAGIMNKDWRPTGDADDLEAVG